MSPRKRSTLGWLVLLFLSACAAHSFYLDPLKSGRRSPDGKQQGAWKYWYDPERARLKAQGEYLDDRQVGAWVYWHESGAKEWEGALVDERLQGIHTYWHENGTMRAQGAFDRGLESGHWTYWTKDGVKYREGDYDKGVRTGRWTFFYPGGEVLAEGAFQDGVKVGRWSFTDQSGAPLSKTFPETAGGETTGDAQGVPEPWMLAEVDKEVELPLRSQPWTVFDEEYLEFNVGRYLDGKPRNVVQIQNPYVNDLGKERRRDRARSKAVLDRSLSDFKFVTFEGEWTRLEDWRGKKLVLVVLRGFAGEVCAYCVAQARALAEKKAEIEAEGAEVLLVYPGREDRLKAFVEGYQLLLRREGPPPFPMLCDTRTELVEALDIVDNLARPTTLILDKAGVVRWAYVGVDKDDRPSVEEILGELRDLP